MVITSKYDLYIYTNSKIITRIGFLRWYRQVEFLAWAHGLTEETSFWDLLCTR